MPEIGEINQNQKDNIMFKTLIKYLQLGLDLLKADPAEKDQIEALQAQVTTLNAELAQARTQTPSPEETEQINVLLGEFAAIEAVKPKPPITLEGVVPVPVVETESTGNAEPQPNPVDTPPSDPIPETDGTTGGTDQTAAPDAPSVAE